MTPAGMKLGSFAFFDIEFVELFFRVLLYGYPLWTGTFW